jgi:oligopeptide transport system substrate-binding protein
MNKINSTKLLTGAALFITALFLLSSCSDQHDQKEKRVFNYNESNGITSLDPAFARDIEVMWATNQLFDGLVELDSNMQVIPCIAKSWDLSDDGLTYTFYLRDDARFHPSPLFSDTTGRKVTAADFIFSFSRLMDPLLASPATWIFSSIDFTNHGGFEAPDDSTLIIHLKQAFQPFLGMLTMQYCNVVPKEVVSHFGADFREHPIGSGPFKFAFWYENVALVFHKNENYWMFDPSGNRLPYLDAVKIDFVKDMSVEFQGLLQGRYDFMSGIHNSFKDELLDAQGNLAEAYTELISFQKTPFIKTDYLGIFVDPCATTRSSQRIVDLFLRRSIPLHGKFFILTIQPKPCDFCQKPGFPVVKDCHHLKFPPQVITLISWSTFSTV